MLALLESCGYMLDYEPIDLSEGPFADPGSNASFVFQANPFLKDGPASAEHISTGAVADDAVVTCSKSS